MSIRTDNFVLFPGHVFHDILDAAGIAPGPDVVGRVREVVGQISAITAVMRGRRELGDTMADRVAAVIACDDARGVALGKCDNATDSVGVPVFGQAHDRVQWLAARYSDALIDRDSLVGKLETVRGERDSARTSLSHYVDKVNECGALLDRAGIPTNGVSQRLTVLIVERDAAQRSRDRHCATIRECVGLLDTAGVARGGLADRVRALVEDRDEARGERDAARDHYKNALTIFNAIDAHIKPLAMHAAGDRLDDVIARVVAALTHAREDLDALRAPKVAAVEWVGWELRIDGSAVAAVFASIALPGQWYVYRPEQPKCWATSRESAVRLAELLANHDPGGTWRVNGDVVSPDTVRMICPSVAVTWGES